jgi:hypothetical protein
MATEEATGRLNLFDDPSPLPNTKNINILVEGIRKKTRGADVRESIAKALEVTYETAAKEGNANMEVAKARGTFDYLSDRFSTIDNIINSKADEAEIKAMLNNILDGSPKGTYPSISALRTAKPTGDKGIFITTDNGHWNYWNGSSWADGGSYQSPIEGVPNQFGVIFDGLLTIDRKSKTVSVKKDTWISFGNKNYAPDTNLSINYEPTGLSEYVVYDYKNKGLSVMTLANVKNITATQVILAIMYKGTLHYPVNSIFVKTIGYSEYTQDSLIGSVVQGKIVYDNYSNTFSFSGIGEQNEIIVSKGTSYYSIKEHENLQLSSGFLHHLILDTMENKFKLVKSSAMSSGATFTSKNTELLIASIYLGELTHYSNNNFITTTKSLLSNAWQLEELIVDLQTKKTVIVTLGDSTTDGWRTSNYTSNNDNINNLKDGNNTYSGILNNIINQQRGYNFDHKIYNRGFSGKNISWLRQNLDAVLLPVTEPINYAFIAMGINDMVYDASKIKSFRDDHINVVNRLLAKGIKPVLMSTQAEFENYKRFGSKINAIADNIKKDLAKELGLPFIDYNAGTSNILNHSEYKLKDLIPDMCHFGDLGHQKGAEFLASQLIPQTVFVSGVIKIGYQNNKVASDLNYSDFLTDEQKDVKWTTRIDGFDLEGQLNSTQTKTMFEVSVYIERPSIVHYFGDNVIMTSNEQSLSDGAVLDVGFYRIIAKNRPGVASKFRGLKFNLKEV